MTMASDNYFLHNLAADPNFDFINSIRHELDGIDDDNQFNPFLDSPYDNSTFQCTYVDPFKFVIDYKNVKNISIMTLNVQSLNAKFNDLFELIATLTKNNCSPDVLCLQELWQFPSDVDFQLPGYSKLNYKLRGNGVQGGGLVPM